MRELTKSLFSLSMAMPLFGLQQAARLASQPDPRRTPEQATDALKAVSSAAQSQLGATLYQVFALGDRWQRRAVDLAFSIVPEVAAAEPDGSPSRLPWSSCPKGTPAPTPADPTPAEGGSGESRQPGWGPMPSTGGP